MNSAAQEAKTRMVAVFVVFATLAAVLLTVLVSSRNASTPIDTSVGSSVSTTSAKGIDTDTCVDSDPACLAAKRGLEIIKSRN